MDSSSRFDDAVFAWVDVFSAGSFGTKEVGQCGSGGWSSEMVVDA